MAKNVVSSMLDSAETTIKFTEREVNNIAKPVRTSILKRFPIIFDCYPLLESWQYLLVLNT